MARQTLDAAGIIFTLQNSLNGIPHSEVLVAAKTPARHLTPQQHFHMLQSLRKIVLRHSRMCGVDWVSAFRLRTAVVLVNPFVRAHPVTEKRSELTLDFLAVVQYWKRHDLRRLAEFMNGCPGNVELVVHPCPVWNATYLSEIRYSPANRAEEVRILVNLHPLLRETSALKENY